MARKRLRILLLAAALFSLPFQKVKAFYWLPVGDGVDVNGFATTGGIYDGGDRIYTPIMRSEDAKKNVTPTKKKAAELKSVPPGFVVPVDYNTSWEATSGDSTLNLVGLLNGTGDPVELKVDGDVTIKALTVDGTVNVCTPVTFIPYTNPDGNPINDGLGYSQIQFEVAEGRTMTVNVDHNLEFRGITPGGNVLRSGVTRAGEEEATQQGLDLYLTFRGRGQTTFRMANGVAIKFTGDIDATNPVDVLNNYAFTGFSNNAGGTKVLITMDQTQDDINNGRCKVLFQRKNFLEQTERCLVMVGPNSILSYVSIDQSGLDYLENPGNGGFGSVAFDPSNAGTGRMILLIMGAYTFGFESGLFTPADPEFYQRQFVYPFNDGTVIVAGHRVAGYDPAQIRTTLNYSVPAGAQAIFKVCDDLAYKNRDLMSAYDPAPAGRRGLLVVNDAQSVGKRMSDPYYDFFNGAIPGEEGFLRDRGMGKLNKRAHKKCRRGSFPQLINEEEEGFGGSSLGHEWSASFGVDLDSYYRNSRTCFIVGVNGLLDIYHNTFFDYVAGSINQPDILARADFGADVIKKKNPAAFVIDGIDTTLFSDQISQFTAADPAARGLDGVVTAQIKFRGNGSAHFRCAASSKYGYIFGLWSKLVTFGEEEEEGEGLIISSPRALVCDNPNFDWDAALIVDSSVLYDGQKLAAGQHSKTNGEGEHVFENEGLLKVVSVANTTLVDPSTGLPRDYASTVENAGFLSMPTITFDYTGHEVDTRPLVRNHSYDRYNSPAIFLNNNASFYNSTIQHSDVTKCVNGLPNSSDPALTGGERLFFADTLFVFDGSDRDRYRWPELRFYNNILDLEESLNASGIRFVVQDYPKIATSDGNNNSIVRFFDHGDVNDTFFLGHGRLFMMGTHNNRMADGSTNLVTESAYTNVFKINGPGDGSSATLNLSLQNGDQFPVSVNPDEYAAQRAHHLFLHSCPNLGTCNMAIGWPTIQGDSSLTSFPYANTAYGPIPKETLSSNPDDLFNLDALLLPPAVVTVDGQFITFGGFDSLGTPVAARGPITRFDNKGTVYANHGGRLTVASPTDPGSVPPEVIVDTVIAQRVWNDWNLAGTTRVTDLSGRVDLPHDQSTFLPNAAVQPWGFTAAMFAARSAETDGLVRLGGFFNQDLGRVRYDRSGAEDVVINWNNIEGDDHLFDDIHRSPLASRFASVRRRPITRLTEIIDFAIDRPDNLLFVGAGEDIRQLRVAGATQSNPFYLLVTGDAINPVSGRVREFVSVPLTQDNPFDDVVGAGDHGILFLENGGRIGLGTREINSHSGGNSWKILGKDHVQIVPLGDGIIDLNADLVIEDRQALIASTQFSSVVSNRLTFYSDLPREIRVIAGGELDLSSFGQSENLQQIAFGGQVRLIMEPGSIIRFPSNPVGGVVLYFNDQSQLIFEGPFEPQTEVRCYANSDAAQADRIKIVGIGQIWGNKDAQIMVNNNALVGVQNDDVSLFTDIIISMNRQSNFNIGTPEVSGGAFEVGNPSSVLGGEINFTLSTIGENAGMFVGRGGFFGLAAGVINRPGNLNGDAVQSQNPVLDIDGFALLDEDDLPVFTPDTTHAWQVQGLFEVNNITIDLQAGFIDHARIYDGSHREASLMAFGPIAFNWQVNVNGQNYVAVRGGGNVMFVPDAGVVRRVNVWDYAGLLPNDEHYSLFASAPLMIDRDDIAGTASFATAGRSLFTNSQDSFFNFMTIRPFVDQPRKKVAFSRDLLDNRAGYLNHGVVNPVYATDVDRIVRVENPRIVGGEPDEALESGALIGQPNGNADPVAFGILETTD
ncbi:hypothetical protein IPF37_04490 [bacterium]|nr:MAG: hypothetical protein IPF37_04490 [bacterium]